MTGSAKQSRDLTADAVWIASAQMRLAMTVFAAIAPRYFAPTITSIAPLTIASSSLRGTPARERMAMV
jgi:hypothetical protein